MIQERITNAVAASAVISPWWLPSLQQLNDGLPIAVGILGAVWLAIQIIWRIMGWDRPRN